MKVLIVSRNEVRQWLPMNECIDVMAETLKMQSQRKTVNPLRQSMWLPDRKGLLGMMPAYLADYDIMGIKVVSVFSGNHDTQYDSHQGAVKIFETKNGCLLAIVDASEITAIRTAAVSALATDLLANKRAKTLAILGTGVQGTKHLEAIRLVRKIEQVQVWDLDTDKAHQFAERESKRHSIPIAAMKKSHDAALGADIICTTSAATEPILFGESIKDGVHINAVGASFKMYRELDTPAVVKSSLFVDRRESTLNEAGDFLFPKEEGAIGDDHIQGELGEILLNQITGRKSSDEITLFKSLGLAIEDVASAYFIYQKMSKAGQGLWVELGGLRQG